MRVFLSYRHEDSVGFAGRLSDALQARFGQGSVTRYVNGPEPGDVSLDSARQQLANVDTLLVMIGPHWLDGGTDHDDDFVRVQIEAALAARKLVIAVLVDGARMPAAHELPASIAGFAECETFPLDDASWAADVARLENRLGASRPPVTTPGKASLVREGSPAWMLTGTLLAALLLLGAFLLTTPFWRDEVPPVVGTWTAEVVYEDDRDYAERFEFRLTGRALSGSASYRGMRRAIEEGQLDGDELSFVVRTRERRGNEQIELRHAYLGVLDDDRIRFRLETSGDAGRRAPIEFEARRLAD